MRRMIVLGALIVLAAYPAMGAAPIEKGAKELAPAQKQVQGQTQSLEKPVAPRPPAGGSRPSAGGSRSRAGAWLRRGS